MLAVFQIPILGLFFLVPIVYALAGRGSRGLWIIWGLALCLLPSWINWQISPSVGFETRDVIAIGGLIAMLVAPIPRVKANWQIADTLLVVTYLMMLITEIMAGSAGIFAPVPLFMFWILPYLIGRRFLATADDIGRFTKLMAPIIAFTAFVAMVEMVANVNPYNRIFARYAAYQEIHGEFSRMGMRRAAVGVAMPISFGMIMILVMPWSLLAARQPGRASWHRWLPMINLGGAVCSLSRGPIMFCVLGWVASVFFRQPRTRRLLGTLAIVGGGFVVFALEPLLNFSADFIGDATSATIVLNGRVEAVNSTRQRALMREAYAPAIDDAGLFGFSTGEVLTIPGRYRIPKVLSSIESHYVFHQLAYGQVGIVLFVAYSAAVLFTLARVSWRPRGPIEDLAGCLAGAHIAVLLGVLSVYFGEEYRSVWLFNAGLAGNLMDLLRQQRKSDLLRLATVAASSPSPSPSPGRPF